jgi:hypothetical protein
MVGTIVMHEPDYSRGHTDGLCLCWATAPFALQCGHHRLHFNLLLAQSILRCDLRVLR